MSAPSPPLVGSLPSGALPADPLPATDVAIIGGGVIGLAVGLELARRGVQVMVLERDRVGHACSYGNAGWLTPALAVPLPAPGMLFKSMGWLLNPESPLYIQPRLDPALARWIAGFLLATRRSTFERGVEALVGLCRWSVDLWEEMSQNGGDDFGFQRYGLVCVYETAKGCDAARRGVEVVARHGIRWEEWSADQVRTAEPAVVGAQIGALHYPDDAHCEPYRAVLALAAEARKAGVTIVEDAEVFDIAQTGGAIRMLRTTRGDVAVKEVVLAAGAWCEELGKLMGKRVPILGAKGYSLIIPRLNPHPRRSIYLAERKVAINPHADALRIAGTLELVKGDLSINQRRVNAILRGARGMLPLPADLEIRELWRGLRPCTPDGMPQIGRARGAGNLWLATGHQMTGLKTATGTGRLLAELMTGATPSIDPLPFRADRY
jgi:D-amino-acid dehydrogenase